jgi:hypothetical protein
MSSFAPISSLTSRLAPGIGIGDSENSIGRGLLNGLVAYWPLDEASGTRRDLSGNGLTLTDNNTVTGNPGPSSKLPLASQFTAANSEYLNRANSAVLQTGGISFTVCAWVYLDTAAAGNPRIAHKGRVPTDANREWALTYLSASDRFALAVSPDGTGTGNATATANTFGSPGTGVWRFIEAGYDLAAGLVFIRVNNGAADTAALADGPDSLTGDFGIGGEYGVSFWDGRIAGVGFWQRLWTRAEATYMRNDGQGRQLLLGRGFV